MGASGADAGAESRTGASEGRRVWLWVGLGIWLALLGVRQWSALTRDRVTQFARPVEVLVRRAERPLLLSGGMRLTSNDEDDPAVAMLEQGLIRLAAWAAEGSPEVGAEDLLELRVRIGVLERSAGADEPRFARLAGATPSELESPLIEACAVAFDGATTTRPDACVAAAIALRDGFARDYLLVRLARELDRPPQVVAALDRSALAHENRASRLLVAVGTSGLIALVGLVVLLWMGFRSVDVLRVDPRTTPNTWPAWHTGLGVFAGLALGNEVVHLLSPVLLGLNPFGVRGLLAGLPLLWLITRCWDVPRRRRSELGLGLERAQIERAMLLASAGYLLSGVAGTAITTKLADPNDAFFNHFLDIVVLEGTSIRVRAVMEACVWAPLFEELGVRAALFGGLRSRLGFLPAALLSSIAFGAMHSYGPAGMASTAGLGFVLATVYERTRSIWVCVLTHALFNLAAFQLSFAMFG